MSLTSGWSGILDKKKGLCTHGMDQRRWCETYNCREVAYAVTKLGYTLFAIHEGLIYTNLQPIFEQFMKLMASKKIRYSKVPPSYKTNILKYCDEVNQEMDFSDPLDTLTPEKIEENPYQCTFIKGIMNICIGKMSQSQQKTSVNLFKMTTGLLSSFRITVWKSCHAFLLLMIVSKSATRKKKAG